MNKKAIIVGVLVIILLTVGAGIWMWREDGKSINIASDAQNQQQTANNISSLQQQGNELAWYQVPELGIKFEVTPDTKNDLKYFIDENQKVKVTSANFYFQSAKDFIDKNSKIKRTSLASYGIRAISKVSREENEKSRKVNGRPWCLDDDIILDNGEFIFCEAKGQADVFDSVEQYKQYEKSVEGKDFGELFGNIEFMESE